MTHARIPDVSIPLALPARCLDAESLPWHADLIFAAVERHSEAWHTFQVAPDGDPSLEAEDEMDAALDALVATPCANRQGAFCLLGHLCWWLGEEAEYAWAYQPGYAVARARAADLAMLLNAEPLPIAAAPLPGIERSARAGAPSSVAMTATTRARMGGALSSLGEALAALAIVIGGCGLVGIASLL